MDREINKLNDKMKRMEVMYTNQIDQQDYAFQEKRKLKTKQEKTKKPFSKVGISIVKRPSVFGALINAGKFIFI
jgi:hypothetical protein